MAFAGRGLGLVREERGRGSIGLSPGAGPAGGQSRGGGSGGVAVGRRWVTPRCLERLPRPVLGRGALRPGRVVRAGWPAGGPRHAVRVQGPPVFIREEEVGWSEGEGGSRPGPDSLLAHRRSLPLAPEFLVRRTLGVVPRRRDPAPTASPNRAGLVWAGRPPPESAPVLVPRRPGAYPCLDDSHGPCWAVGHLVPVGLRGGPRLTLLRGRGLALSLRATRGLCGWESFPERVRWTRLSRAWRVSTPSGRPDYRPVGRWERGSCSEPIRLAGVRVESYGGYASPRIELGWATGRYCLRPAWGMGDGFVGFTGRGRPGPIRVGRLGGG